MTVELRVPSGGESITEVEVGDWRKAEGDAVDRDETVVEIQTDKASMELPAPVRGKIQRILKKKGDLVHVGDVIAIFEENGGAAPQKAVVREAKRETPPAPVPAGSQPRLGPAARRALRDQHSEAAPPVSKPTPPTIQWESKGTAKPPPGGREEEIVPMTLLRRKIAERLVQAQHTAAILTTFNELDMSAVSNLRKEYQDAFVAKYKIKLGFMSFFVKASVEALKEIPQVNAEIRGTDIIYKNYYDIGVAIGSGKGLVVPVIRNAERLSFAEIEQAIADLSQRAKDSKLSLEDLQGGTFSISNGGIYGSLLSTPILNPPQSGILGMHAIQDRVIVRDGQMVVRPMMYVALSYDHRLVDGREAVTFLKRIKEIIENPARMLLEV